jgi:tetratricopeptide (TPR) repeat protein
MNSRFPAARRTLAILAVVFGGYCAPVFGFDQGGFDFIQPATDKPARKTTASERLFGNTYPPVDTQTLPRGVAILPFDNATQETGIAEEVRRAFYNQFSSKPYSDIELAAVDARILALAHEKKAVRDNTVYYQTLCRPLGCDGVITGRVLEFRKMFAGVYSELGIVAEISLINVKTGAVVLTRTEEITFREGGLSLTPIGLAMSAMSAALNLRDIQRVRLVSELGYTIAKTIPDPVGGFAAAGPRIEGLLSNAAESPFGLGKVITIAMQGETNGAAVFDIGNYRRALPMLEKTPGVYVGEYRVQDGDMVKQAPLVATLRGRNGLLSSWYDTNLINIDSQAPAAPARLSAKSQAGQVLLQWDALTQTADLAGYQVLRSAQPLSGFTPIGVVQTPEFADQEANGMAYRYYRVIALDQAGNASEPGPVARGRVLISGYQPLSGRVDRGLELAGSILVSGETHIPAGVTLRIAPGTRLVFEPGASLLVQGGLSSDSRDEPIEFAAQGETTWGGIRIDGGNIGLRGFSLSGASTGLQLQNAQGILEAGQISHCATGLQIAGGGGVSINNLRISDNQIGVRLERSDAELTQNRIAANQLGVDMQAFTGVLRDNAIFQNALNLRSEAGTLLDANYWGSLDPAALRIEGGLVGEALNRPPPDGKLVTLRVSPCAGLTPEDCQRKAAEALIEGGQLFRAKNYGRALTRFEDSIAAQPSADAYYFAALCHQEMREEQHAIERLQDGIAAYPSEPALRRALGMLHFQRGETSQARQQLGEALRLSPNDRQAAFMLQRLGDEQPAKTEVQP